MSEKPDIIICARVRGNPRLAKEPQTILVCTQCGESIYVGLSSLEIAKRHPKPIVLVCEPCARELVRKDNDPESYVMDLTPEQRAIVERSLGRPVTDRDYEIIERFTGRRVRR